MDQTSVALVAIPVTYYRPPHGKKDVGDMYITAHLKPKYDVLAARGGGIALEILRTREVSVTIEHDAGDYDIRLISPKSPIGRVNEAISEMLEAFNPEMFDRWLEDVSE